MMYKGDNSPPLRRIANPAATNIRIYNPTNNGIANADTQHDGIANAVEQFRRFHRRRELEG